MLVLGTGNEYSPEAKAKIARMLEQSPRTQPFPLHANLAPTFVAEALFGDLTVKIPIILKDGEQIGSGPARQELDRNGKLRPWQNTRFSAIAVPTVLNPGYALVEREYERRHVRGMPTGESLALIETISNDYVARGLYDPEARVVRVSVYHNPWAGVPLPFDFFRGPYDQHHGVAEGLGFGLLAEGVAAERLHRGNGAEE